MYPIMITQRNNVFIVIQSPKIDHILYPSQTSYLLKNSFFKYFCFSSASFKNFSVPGPKFSSVLCCIRSSTPYHDSMPSLFEDLQYNPLIVTNSSSRLN